MVNGISRRAFLSSLAATTAATAFFMANQRKRTPRSMAQAPYWMGCVQPNDFTYHSRPHASLKPPASLAFRAKADGSNIETVVCSCFGHSIETLPVNPERAIVISNGQSSVSIVDWQEKREICSISLVSEKKFYGHGLPLKRNGQFAGQYLITGYTANPDFSVKNANLFVVDLNVETATEVAALGFSSLHQLCEVDDDHLLAGVSGTIDSGATVAMVSEIHSLTPRLSLFPSPFAADPKRRVSHQIRTSRNSTVWSSHRMTGSHAGAQFDGASLLFVNEESRGISCHTFKDDLAGSELLSLSYDPTHNRLWATFPTIQKTIVMSVADRKIERVYTLPNGAHFVLAGLDSPFSEYVLMGSSQQMSIVDRGTLDVVESIRLLDVDYPAFIVPHATWG